MFNFLINVKLFYTEFKYIIFIEIFYYYHYHSITIIFANACLAIIDLKKISYVLFLKYVYCIEFWNLY